jgi:hypothetical protein
MKPREDQPVALAVQVPTALTAPALALHASYFSRANERVPQQVLLMRHSTAWIHIQWRPGQQRGIIATDTLRGHALSSWRDAYDTLVNRSYMLLLHCTAWDYCRLRLLPLVCERARPVGNLTVMMTGFNLHAGHSSSTRRLTAHRTGNRGGRDGPLS